MHLKQQNHSRRFWRLVELVCPDFRAAERWLKTRGGTPLVRRFYRVLQGSAGFCGVRSGFRRYGMQNADGPRAHLADGTRDPR